MLRRLLAAGALLCVFAGPSLAAEPQPAPAPSAAEAETASPVPPTDLPVGRAAYVEIVGREARARGLPPEVADAVAQIESGYRPSAVGGVGEIGLIQIRPSTAAMLGHRGGALALFEPETNIRYAVAYLAGAWRLAGGDLCRTLMKYRAGHKEERMSPLSAEYCRRARAHLASLGSPLAFGAEPVIDPVLAAAAPPAEPRAPAAGPRRGWIPKTPEESRRFWAAHEAKIKALTARIVAKRKLRIARGY
jgi:hypothetical protein